MSLATRTCIHNQMELIPDDDTKQYVKDITGVGRAIISLLTQLHPEDKYRNCTPEAVHKRPNKDYRTLTPIEPTLELLHKSPYANKANEVDKLYNELCATK